MAKSAQSSILNNPGYSSLSCVTGKVSFEMDSSLFPNYNRVGMTPAIVFKISIAKVRTVNYPPQRLTPEMFNGNGVRIEYEMTESENTDIRKIIARMPEPARM